MQARIWIALLFAACGAIALEEAPWAENRERDKPALTFTRHEKQYRLSSIWEAGTDGRTVAGS